MYDVAISFSDDIAHLSTLPYYQTDKVALVLSATLDVINTKISDGLVLPYYINCNDVDWMTLYKSLDIYICTTDEGRTLNLDARGKDYATNILSYPSHLPCDILKAMGQIPLGELIICHDVLIREATEQGKAIEHHLTHLLVHGVLHLLGFDHELGQAQAIEMESFELEILVRLGVSNPYD